MKRFLALVLPFFIAISPLKGMDSVLKPSFSAGSAVSLSTINLKEIFGYKPTLKEAYLKNLQFFASMLLKQAQVADGVSLLIQKQKDVDELKRQLDDRSSSVPLPTDPDQVITPEFVNTFFDIKTSENRAAFMRALALLRNPNPENKKQLKELISSADKKVATIVLKLEYVLASSDCSDLRTVIHYITDNFFRSLLLSRLPLGEIPSESLNKVFANLEGVQTLFNKAYKGLPTQVRELTQLLEKTTIALGRYMAKYSDAAVQGLPASVQKLPGLIELKNSYEAYKKKKQEYKKLYQLVVGELEKTAKCIHDVRKRLQYKKNMLTISESYFEQIRCSFDYAITAKRTPAAQKQAQDYYTQATQDQVSFLEKIAKRSLPKSLDDYRELFIDFLNAREGIKKKKTKACKVQQANTARNSVTLPDWVEESSNSKKKKKKKKKRSGSSTATKKQVVDAAAKAAVLTTTSSVVATPKPVEIKYDPRVTCCFEEDSKWGDLYHTFCPLADKYIFRLGIKTDWHNRAYSGQVDDNYSLAGEIVHQNGTKETVVFTCCKDPKGVCYHRGYTKKNKSDLFMEYFKQGYWKIQRQLYPSGMKLVGVLPHMAQSAEDKILKDDDLLVRIWDARNRVTLILYKGAHA